MNWPQLTICFNNTKVHPCLSKLSILSFTFSYLPHLVSLLDDANPGEITENGILQLCEDLTVDAHDVVILALGYHMKAANMCTYTRDEFRRDYAI